MRMTCNTDHNRNHDHCRNHNHDYHRNCKQDQPNYWRAHNPRVAENTACATNPGTPNKKKHRQTDHACTPRGSHREATGKPLWDTGVHWKTTGEPLRPGIRWETTGKPLGSYRGAAGNPRGCHLEAGGAGSRWGEK